MQPIPTEAVLVSFSILLFGISQGKTLSLIFLICRVLGGFGEKETDTLTRLSENHSLRLLNVFWSHRMRQRYN